MTEDRSNRAIYLDSYVKGSPLSTHHFSTRELPLGTLEKDDVLVEAMCLSVDPYMRGRMTGLDTFYLPQFDRSQPIFSIGVARVVNSRSADHAEGDVVIGAIDWADRSIHKANSNRRPAPPLSPLDPGIRKPSHALGAAGMTGITAFFGIVAVAKPRRGETVVISGAAGAVGSVAGQIAKIHGARVIGLASSQDKREALVTRLGFDAALDYRSATLAEQLTELAPHGPDVYFDNVGGDVSQTVMSTMLHPARVIECGQISSYDDADGGWKVDIRPIHARGLRLQSFTPAIFSEYEPAARAQLLHWIKAGKLVVLETEHRGLESAPDALVDLFHGGNVGKMVVTLME